MNGAILFAVTGVVAVVSISAGCFAPMSWYHRVEAWLSTRRAIRQYDKAGRTDTPPRERLIRKG